MERRPFIAGIATGFTLLGGCIGNDTSGSEPSPTDSERTEPANTETAKITTESWTTKTEIATESSTTQTETVTESSTNTTVSTRERKNACKGVSFVAFYGLSTDFADNMWSPDTVAVGLSLGAGEELRLVVFENDSILGMTRVEAPDEVGVAIDGTQIPLDIELSGEHTIRVVAYPITGKSEQFKTEQATPCQYEGEPVQTEPTTIDFSRFSENTSTARTTGSEENTTTGTG